MIYYQELFVEVKIWNLCDFLRLCKYQQEFNFILMILVRLYMIYFLRQGCFVVLNKFVFSIYVGKKKIYSLYYYKDIIVFFSIQFVVCSVKCIVYSI